METSYIPNHLEVECPACGASFLKPVNQRPEIPPVFTSYERKLIMTALSQSAMLQLDEATQQHLSRLAKLFIE